MFFLLLLGVVSRFQALYQSFWSTSSWFWYRVKDRDLASVFYICISSFPSSICWRDYQFSIMFFGLLCQRSVGYRCVGLCLNLLFWSIVLPVCFYASTMLFLFLWLCSIVWSWILWCFQPWTFLLRIALVIPCVLYFHVCFTMFFLFLCRMLLEFW
jgi:hypothetical protein